MLEMEAAARAGWRAAIRAGFPVTTLANLIQLKAAPLAAAADESPGRGLASRSSRCRRAAEGDGGGPRPDLLLPEMLPPGALPRAGADCGAALRPSSGGQVKGESSTLWRIASGLSHASLPAWL